MIESILLIIITNYLIYRQTIGYSIICDDIRRYKQIKEGLYQRLHNPLDIIKERCYGLGTFGLREKNGKPDWRLDHSITLALHISIAVTIYLVFGSNTISLITSLLYSVNPCNLQTSVWLNGRRYAINALLSLLIYASPCLLILYPATFLFQYTAFFIPLVHFDQLTFWTLTPIPLVAIGGYKYIKSKIESRLSRIPNNDHSSFFKNSTWNISVVIKRLIVIVKSFGFNLFQILIPRLGKMHYRSLYWWGRTEEGNRNAYSLNWEFVKGLLALGLVGLGVIWGDKWVYVFVGLGILQWSCIVPVFQYNADRYMSVVSPFVTYLLVTELVKLGHWGVGACVGLGMWYLGHLLLSLRQYKSIEDMLEYHIFHDPDLSNMRLEQVKALMTLDNLEANMKALVLIRDGIVRHRCADYASLMFAARLSRKFGNFDEALVLADMAYKNHFVGDETTARLDRDALRSLVEGDRMKASGVNGAPSRQVRRAMERKK